MKRLFLAIFLLLGLGSLAYAGGAKFAINKQLCLGNPASMADPGLCQESDPVPQNVPVFYMITLTNPWLQPAQTLTLNDTIPAQFTASGAMFCRTDANVTVPYNPSMLSGVLGTINLAPGQTIHCFVAGAFTNSGKSVKNVVQGINNANNAYSADVTVQVPPVTPIAANLKLTKTVQPGSIDVSSGAQLVTYTIKILNQGPGAVDVGQWFMLHDTMSLLPGSVPLNVAFSSAACTVSPNTTSPPSDCLDPAGPQFASGSGNLFVGTMNQNAYFDWGFAAGQGHIAAGDTITLTIELSISAVDDLDCVRSPGANGLANKAWFTLIDANAKTALADANLSDNSATANLVVTVPYSTVSPTCATGQLDVTKTQLNPPANTVAGWGTQVDYRITIKNVSLPAQTITIKKHDLQDTVTEGINTPPFLRNHVVTSCNAGLSSASLCNDFSPAGNNLQILPSHRYSFYGETDLAWDSDEKIELKPGEQIVFDTAFRYEEPDCETVPKSAKRPIINTARVTYEAQPYGSPKGTPKITQTQSDDAETLMKEQPACKFRVTKQLMSGGPTVQFGVPLVYQVTFTNLGAKRNIGTLLDAARIEAPNYAIQLPFTSNWKCITTAGITSPYVPTGSSSSGAINYVNSAVQGAPVAISTIGTNISFDQNTTITCKISITLSRPASDDPFCNGGAVNFENVAMMDVTSPFNTNITWPPAAGNVPGSLVNPVPQNYNWASVRTALPKCWDAHINKTASVAGLLNGSAPWTFAGNPNAVSYAISVSNDGQSPLGTGTAPAVSGSGWIVQDKLQPPYTSATQNFVNCAPPALWCHSAPADPRGEIGVKNLNPGATGNWNLVRPGPNVLAGQDITNCVWIKPVGAQAGPGYYFHDAATVPGFNCNPPTSPGAAPCPANTSNLFACVTVPVFEVTKISVRKRIVDQTGANVTVASGYGIQVNCTPYGIATFVAATNSTGYSAYHTVYPVPVGATCTVTEPGNPIPPGIAQKCVGAANVNVSTAITPLPTPLSLIDNPVTVTNTYSCKGSQMGQLEVIKQLNTLQTPVQFPATNWTINTNCNPAGSATALTLITPASGNAQITASSMITAPVSANCSVSEVTPANTVIPAWFQSSCGTAGAEWDVPQYSVNNGPFSSTPPTVTLTSGINKVVVKNGWHCKPAPSSGTNVQVQVFKRVTGPTTQVPPMTFGITPGCNPASSPAALSVTTMYPHTSYVGAGAFSIPAGTTCNLGEVLPDAKTNASMVAFCSAQAPNIEPKWLPPTFSTAPTGTPVLTMPLVAGSSMNLFITNTWACGPPAAAKVKPSKPRFKFHIGIPLPGLGGGGKSKEPPTDINPPTPGRP